MRKLIKDVDVKNKKVIIRCDLNVSFKDDVIKDDTRIVKSIKTIKYLLVNGASVIIMSHLGKVKTEEDKKDNSLKIVVPRLSELLNREVRFISTTHGKELEKTCKELVPGEVILMENTRFEDVPNELESKCDDKLSKYWASLGDMFVNDAFGSSHRAHASVCGIAKYLPSYNGFLMEEEIRILDKVLKDPERPFTVVMGGAKVDDKLELIKALIDKCDNLIVGGGIANTFLLASGYNVGTSLVSESMINEVKELINNYSKKIVMPVDVVVGKLDTDYCEKRLVSEVKDDENILDIGFKSINKFRNVLYSSNTIFLNGTVGLYFNKLFEEGTKEIFDASDDSDATVIAAGGDCVTAVNHFGYGEKFLISTGGGAALEYLAYGDLPGIIK